MPPPDVCLYPLQDHGDLLRAVATSLAVLDAHERRLATALAMLGDIDLPPGAPNALDQAQLQAAAPLYFASELESAGLLPTAELVAGLFASGAITQPLGPTAQMINAFWRGRRERLDANERNAIFARAIEAPYFGSLMAALCEAIVVQAEDRDMRKGVTLENTAQNLGEFLAQRVDAMAAIAARDIVDNINAALAFLRDRLVQTAFGVNSLWALVSIAGAVQGQGASTVRNHVERGRAGQTVLLWLAAHYPSQTLLLDANNTDDIEIIAAAQRWLSARPLSTAAAQTSIAPALPIAA
ncbi:MAG: hypothetical protein LC715_05170 [Gammaproteobacteria bacterium]|nr:hypothetical protein [Gammaproteobacteria bacterium]